jgi:ATP-dependent Clp protease ATP-binding subunit ClpA
MLERLTADARAVVKGAADGARELGHRFIGTEHLLLALASADVPAGEVLREQGVTPELIKEQIVRQVGLGVGAGLFAGLDEQALAAIGIDLDAVRARIEASFSSDALYRAAQLVYAQQRRRAKGQGGRGWRAWRVWGPLRVRAVEPPPGAVDMSGRYVEPHRQRLPFTPRAKRVLERSFREAVELHVGHIGAEHLALAAVSMDSGLVPSILAALHAHADLLRSAILNRYRQAS